MGDPGDVLRRGGHSDPELPTLHGQADPHVELIIEAVRRKEVVRLVDHDLDGRRVLPSGQALGLAFDEIANHFPATARSSRVHTTRDDHRGGRSASRTLHSQDHELLLEY